jgi:hypothetical protein
MKPLAIAAFALFTTICPAQDSKALDARREASGQFTLEAGEVAVAGLIDRCAIFLGRNILSSPLELREVPPARLQQRITTDRDGCEELLAGILYSNGLALTWLNEKAGIMEVINLSGPRGREATMRAVTRSVEAVLARPELKTAVITTVPLQHINATIATNSLRPFFASTGGPAAGGTLTIANVGNSTALVLCGMQSQVAHAVQLLRTVDVQSKEPNALELELQARIQTFEARLKAIEDKLAGVSSGK